jgi:hypothetical protein
MLSQKNFTLLQDSPGPVANITPPAAHGVVVGVGVTVGVGVGVLVGVLVAVGVRVGVGVFVAVGVGTHVTKRVPSAQM